MSAVVIDFSSALARRRPHAVAARLPRSAASQGALTHDFTFWRGATGARYVHTIYRLLECPELPNANIVLVRRHVSGRAEVMHIGRVEHGAASLNLAEVRSTAARLGADEVHVHFLASGADERAAIERDLSGAGEIAASTRH